VKRQKWIAIQIDHTVGDVANEKVVIGTFGPFATEDKAQDWAADQVSKNLSEFYVIERLNDPGEYL
jgi:hypothetical protein